MAYTLPQLPYSYDALEPYVDARTMEIHYTKHHQGYVNKLNAALEQYPEWASVPLYDLLKRINEVPESISTAVRNNGGGHSNHTLFWQCMAPLSTKQMPSGELAEAINQACGSFEAFKEQFSKAALTRFGSGWAWLVVDANKQVQVLSTPNQDSPLMDGLTPILCLDIWEHAYYLQYQNRRPEYIDRWWSVVNWDFVEEQFKAL